MKKRIARNCDDSKYTVPDDTTHSNWHREYFLNWQRKIPLTCPDRPQRMRHWKQASTEANTNRWLVFNDIQRAEKWRVLHRARAQNNQNIPSVFASNLIKWPPQGHERCESTASGRIAATSHCTSDIQEAAKFSQSLWYSAMLYCYTLETLDLLYIKSLPWIMLEPKQREENGLIATLGSASSASPMFDEIWI